MQVLNFQVLLLIPIKNQETFKRYLNFFLFSRYLKRMSLLQEKFLITSYMFKVRKKLQKASKILFNVKQHNFSAKIQQVLI